MYLGLAFFLLVAAYISFRRTPDFIKQPVYALLHMKHGGQPFTQQGGCHCRWTRGEGIRVQGCYTHRS